MVLSCSVLLSLTATSLLLVSVLLQLIALSSSWWATYSARTEIGKPKEDGHYGLWALCSTKGPHWNEDCDPLDTFFQTPPYTNVAGVLAIIHLIFLLIMLPLAGLRAAQIIRNSPSLGLHSKIVSVAKACVSFVTVIFAILAAIFVSVGENKPVEYIVKKGWAFWIQISIIVVDIIIALICVTENFRYWQEHIQRHRDPMGHRAETYGNPAFDSTSPGRQRRNIPENGNIAYTDASGEPYVRPEAKRISDQAKDKNASNRTKNGTNSDKDIKPNTNCKNGNKNTDDTLTYENPSFQEQTPNMKNSRKYF